MLGSLDSGVRRIFDSALTIPNTNISSIMFVWSRVDHGVYMISRSRPVPRVVAGITLPLRPIRCPSWPRPPPRPTITLQQLQYPLCIRRHHTRQLLHSRTCRDQLMGTRPVQDHGTSTPPLLLLRLRPSQSKQPRRLSVQDQSSLHHNQPQSNRAFSRPLASTISRSRGTRQESGP